MKRCVRCGAEKPATRAEFYGHKVAKDGLSPRCKVCDRWVNKIKLRKRRGDRALQTIEDWEQILRYGL